MKKYEDSSTYFKDLDPMIAIARRAEANNHRGGSSRAKLPFSSSARRSPNQLSPNFGGQPGSPNSIGSSNSFLMPSIPQEFDETELLEEKGDANFSSKVDLFSLRMKMIIDKEALVTGKAAYLEACKAYR